jgi:tetratricopeptide (TPR) repeat protein
LIVAVVSITAVVHAPALSARALSIDDDQYLTQNPLVQTPGWASARRFLSEVLAPSSVEGYYQPLTMISLMLDYGMGGRPENPRAFHRTSLILHAANAALVIVLLYMLFGNPWLAATAGLVFGVHPMTVESVAWVADRKTLLASFFALWSLVLYVRYARKGGLAAYGGCAVLFVLALMSKPTTTLLPGMMLVMDYWPLGRLSRRSVVEKVPLFAISVLSSVVTVVSQGNTCQLGLPTQSSSSRILLGFCHNIVFYLHKMVWPANLTSVYAQPEPMTLGNPVLLVGVVGTLLLIALLLVSLRWTRAFLAGWLMFLVVILPTMGGIGFTIVIASDKYAYLPSVGLLMALVWMATRVKERWFSGPTRAARVWVAVALLMAVVGAEAAATRAYLAKWQTSETLFRHMQSLAPRSAPLHAGLGGLLTSQGRFDEAISHCERALELDPGYAPALSNLGAALIQKGEYGRAADTLGKLVRQQPRYASGCANLGVALYHLGRLEWAVQCFEAALSVKPLHADAQTNLGIALVQLGRGERGLPHLQRAVELLPNDPDARLNLANGLYAMGRLDDAIAQYGLAVQLRPDFAEAHSNLAAALSRQGAWQEAEAHCRKAIQIKPDYPDPRVRLAGLLARRGARAEAVEQYQAALVLAPNDARAAAELKALLSQGSMPASSSGAAAP